MKKLFTLLFAVGMLAVTAQAQPGQRDNRQFDQRNSQQNDQKSYNGGYGDNKQVVVNNPFDKNDRYDDKFSMDRKKEMEIARINQEYDMKIQKVKRTFFLSWFEKQRQIRSLDQQRQREIQQVILKYTYSRKPDFGRDDHSNRHF